MTGAARDGAFADAVHTIHAESGGLLDLLIVRAIDMPPIIAEATAGSPDAIMLVFALEDTMKRIEAAPRRSPMLCVSCPRPLLRKTLYSFAVVLPSRERPTNGLALAVCAKCAVTPQEIREKAIKGLSRVWPSLRSVTITHSIGGQA